MLAAERTKRNMYVAAAIIAMSVVGGSSYGWLWHGGKLYWVARAGLIGLYISIPMTLFELVLVRGSRGEWLRRSPFVIHLSLKALFYCAVIAFSLILDRILFDGVLEPAAWFDKRFLWGAVFALFFGTIVQFILQVARMLGGKMFTNFIVGRYHRPIEEDRIFMFVDLRASTTVAERIGNLKFHALLNRFFWDVAEPVTEHGGEIYKYVGDEVIITWPLRQNNKQCRCVHCYFGIVDKIEHGRSRYLREFGLVPRFRAAVHAGPVVAGEMGDHKQEIGFLGDVVNTTARLQQACTELNRPFLVSDTLLSCTELPGDFLVENMGRRKLRGKESELRVFAVHRSHDAYPAVGNSNGRNGLSNNANEARRADVRDRLGAA